MENLGIDPKLLIAQLLNFVLFFILFQKLISRPFLNFLRQERKKEEEKQHALSEIKKKEDTMSTMEQEMRHKAKKQIDEILAAAKTDAERLRQDMSAQARKEADQIVARARQEIGEEKTKLYKEVKEKAVELSTLIVTSALQEYLTEDVQKKVTHHILNNVSKEVN